MKQPPLLRGKCKMPNGVKNKGKMNIHTHIWSNMYTNLWKGTQAAAAAVASWEN